MMGGTKEMMQPCLTYRHAISLTPPCRHAAAMKRAFADLGGALARLGGVDWGCVTVRKPQRDDATPCPLDLHSVSFGGCTTL